MEFASKLRWIIVVVIAFVLMVLLGWGLASIARSAFKGSGSDSTTTTEQTSTEPINVNSARYIVEGPVVANTEHRRAVVEVTPTVVLMTVYSNYGQTTLVQRSYANNSTSYQNFIKSLDQANATARIPGTTEEDDRSDVGVCSTGSRYILELGDYIRRWTTSCSRDDGTAGGKMTTMRGLFKNQVPDFDDVMNTVPQPTLQW